MRISQPPRRTYLPRSRGVSAYVGAVSAALVTLGIASPRVAEAQSWRKGVKVGLDGAIAFSPSAGATLSGDADVDMYLQPSFVTNVRIGALADFQIHSGVALRYPLGEKFVLVGGALEPGFLFHFGPAYTASMRALVTGSAMTRGGLFVLGFEGHVSPVGFDFGRHGAHHLELYGSVGFLTAFRSTDAPHLVGGGGIRYGGLFL